MGAGVDLIFDLLQSGQNKDQWRFFMHWELRPMQGPLKSGVQSEQVMAKIVRVAPCRNTLDRLT
jgi:hypothetical protein